MRGYEFDVFDTVCADNPNPRFCWIRDSLWTKPIKDYVGNTKRGAAHQTAHIA